MIKKINIFIVAYTALANLLGILPGGWFMFHNVEANTLTLESAEKQIDVYQYMTYPGFISRRSNFFKLSEFICRKESKTNLIIRDSKTNRTYEQSNCVFDKR